MASHRIFYVTQGFLTVWAQDKPASEQSAMFADNDEGLVEFERYLSGQADRPSIVLLDVIEEEFAVDSIPKLGFRDRKSLLQRRLERKFPRTPFRLSLHHGKKLSGGGESMVVHSAISNHDLLDPWLQIVMRCKTPLKGVYSVPLMGADLLARFYQSSNPILFLTQHQQTKLRQVFLRDGRVESGRLSQSPEVSAAEYPEFIVTEIQRSRRYLDRTRLLGNSEQLDICIVAERKLAEKIVRVASASRPQQFTIIDPGTVAKRLGLKSELQSDHHEALYLASAVKRLPKHSYATSGESRYWHMKRMSNAIIAVAVAASAVFSIMSGLYFGDIWSLRSQTTEIEAQVLQLSETFRRENEKFDPIRADSHEMKLAVDTGEYILSNRLPVPWVMQQVGFVMGDYPEIQIRELAWLAESIQSDQRAPRQRAGERLPVPIPAVTSINVDIVADIKSFDGNMRNAFSRINLLASDLASRTKFSDVVVVEYPFDANPHSSVSGDIGGDRQLETARFRLRLRYPLPSTDNDPAEVSNESV